MNLPRLARALSVVVAVAAAGTGVAVQWHRSRTTVRSDTITRAAPELGPRAQVLLPNLDGARVVVPDRPHDPHEVDDPDRRALIRRVRTFLVSTNSHGLRGPEFALPAAGFRILCVGDSVTFGWGVAEDEAWPARLSELLGVEVLNGGVPAMQPETIAAWAVAHGRELDVDLVLFARRPAGGPHGWDGLATAVRATAEGLDHLEVGLVLPPVSTFDVRGSREYAGEHRHLAEALDPIPVLELTDAFRARLPLPGVVLEQDAGRQRMVRLPERTVLVDAAAPPEGLAPEVLAAFEADPAIREPLLFDGGHPDAEGFRVFAAEVAAWVRQQGWVP